ncbi:MAG TPA: hypothetical protein DCM64_07495 [Gammaproteobacteria bacterium]|jgi:class 3 adenylate cyclase|nr:adenylate/guanylate cyclase domain-containing protein [Gammaproteobacteria bacterium]MDP6733412.1 adenylate/guanylate cyclase domain-containing protein [Gammaproteobacteria bacterium]HAJ76284.1 hypothetical protein [Gammaproteobacteria bacterium]
MLSSKQLIDITGISRATLNNYVALGILPNPVVKAPVGETGRATRLGYFEEGAVDCIKEVQKLKKQGHSMTQIAEILGTAAVGAAPPAARKKQAAEVSSVGEQRSLTDLSIDASIDDFPGPAYMVSNSFELIWWNEKATSSFFSCDDNLPAELESRNLLKLLFGTPVARDDDHMMELLKPHMAAGKKRLTQQTLIKIYSTLDARQLNILKDSYDAVESLGEDPIAHYPMILSDGDGEPQLFDLYISFYREGILFTFSPIVLNDDYLLEFLGKRNYVINELLKKRKPYLTDVTVLVADVQNSTRICSELPAEEYFELINNIWQQSEPIFRKYYGTYGKHAGDGMVYYFFPQPDCDHKLNAIKCSLQLKKMMKNITQQWQSKKGWFNDMHLNVGLNEGQEWFGSYHAGGHVEFTVLGETINQAARMSDFARHGSVWATKNMLNQIPVEQRKRINFGITRKTLHGESVFITDTYSNLGNLLDDEGQNNRKFRDIEMLPITEIRDISLDTA